MMFLAGQHSLASRVDAKFAPLEHKFCIRDPQLVVFAWPPQCPLWCFMVRYLRESAAPGAASLLAFGMLVLCSWG